MICPNCSAEFADWAHTCPYCGTVNEAVDEKLYMEHMESLKNRLDKVDDESEKAYRKGISASAKKTLRILGAIVAACAVIVLGIALGTKIMNYVDAKKDVKKQAWLKEEYQVIDDIYATGDYAATLDELYRAEDKSGYSMGAWEHYYFIKDYYSNYADVLSLKEAYARNTVDSYILGIGLYGAVYLMYEPTDVRLENLRTSYVANGGAWGITEEEKEIILTYRKEAEEFLKTTVGWTDEDIKQMYEAACQDGYLRIQPFFDKAEEMLGED